MPRKLATRAQRIENWRKLKNTAVSYLILFGVNGLIAILLGLDITDLSSLSWDSLKVGQKIGLSLYLAVLMVGAILFLICVYKIHTLTEEIYEKTIAD